MANRSLDEIEALTRKALVGNGADAGPAEAVARAVRVAEGYGNKICGLYYLESYCLQLRSGRVDGKAQPEVSRPRPGLVEVDARFGFAQPAFAAGLQQACEAARANGVATLSVAHAHTCTSLGFFTEQIAMAGLIGLGFTNASPIVAAPGGKTRVIGTNPIAFSVPDGQSGVAMLFDQSTTTVALGKITMAKAAGEKIPLGWALDAEGQPTNDPEAALGGSLVSTGGVKGWGFGVMAEVLAAALTGSVLSRDVKPLKAPEGQPHDLGQYYILIDAGASGVFHDRLAALIEAVGQDEGTRLPGQKRQVSQNVEVDDALWQKLEDLAAGVTPSV